MRNRDGDPLERPVGRPDNDPIPAVPGKNPWPDEDEGHESWSPEREQEQHREIQLVPA